MHFVQTYKSQGQRRGTDYQQQSGHLTLFRISRKAHFFLTGHFFSFFIHLERGQPWIGLHVTVVAAPKKLTLYHCHCSYC